MIVPIASIGNEPRARIAGVVRATKQAPLTSSISNEPCVYWDVRRGLHHPPIRRDAQRFWLEDDSGRALVDLEDALIEVHAERQREVMRVADADHVAASARIRELKDELKTAAGPRASALHKERQQLAHVVTLLCAIRAHARGKVHLAGSLGHQERWIHEHASDASDRAAVKLMVESWEVIIKEGQRLEVEGSVSIGPIPPDAGAMGGYRDRPTCAVIRAERVTGMGALAPRPEQPAARSAPERTAPRSQPTFERTVLVVLGAVLAATLLLRLLD